MIHDKALMSLYRIYGQQVRVEIGKFTVL